ncbi:MAG: hypothetical protein HKM05_00030 [Spirochaetales bacterium]|nr:hypothetical protein [Spirochaetales bacterium]
MPDHDVQPHRQQVSPRVLPILVNIENGVVVVVGGGKGAESKLKGMLPFSPRLRLIAPQVSAETLRLAEQFSEHEILYKLWQPSDLAGAVLVYAFTNDPAVNQAIVTESHRHGLLVNAGSNGSFRSLAATQVEGWLLAVSSQGQQPRLARQARDYLVELLRTWLRRGR